MRNRDMPAALGTFALPDQPVDHSPGLTKREAAAIAAMLGQMAASDLSDGSPEGIAKWSVEYADALWDRLEESDGE